MITKRELSKAWKDSYGENFSKEYPGIYKKLGKSFSINTLKKKWKDSYGENFSSNYGGVYRKLNTVDCRLKKNLKNPKCFKSR